jgi:hypothetical protein
VFILAQVCLQALTHNISYEAKHLATVTMAKVLNKARDKGKDKAKDQAKANLKAKPKTKTKAKTKTKTKAKPKAKTKAKTKAKAKPQARIHYDEWFDRDYRIKLVAMGRSSEFLEEMYGVHDEALAGCPIAKQKDRVIADVHNMLFPGKCGIEPLVNPEADGIQ